MPRAKGELGSPLFIPNPDFACTQVLEAERVAELQQERDRAVSELRRLRAEHAELKLEQEILLGRIESERALNQAKFQDYERQLSHLQLLYHQLQQGSKPVAIAPITQPQHAQNLSELELLQFKLSEAQEQRDAYLADFAALFESYQKLQQQCTNKTILEDS